MIEIRNTETKTCMVRVTKGEGLTNRWKVITDAVREGKPLSSKQISSWFTQRIVNEYLNSENISREQHLILKSALGFFQIGCFATYSRKIAVFRRPVKEKYSKVEKITSGFTLLASWSPSNLDIGTIEAEFLNRTNFNGSCKTERFGMGFNELSEATQAKGPGYLFDIYRVSFSSAPLLTVGSEQPSNGDEFIGFYDWAELQDGKATYSGETITFSGRMDILVLSSLCSSDLISKYNNQAVFNRNTKIINDNVIFKQTKNDKELKKLIDWVKGLSNGVIEGLIVNAITTGALIKLGNILSNR